MLSSSGFNIFPYAATTITSGAMALSLSMKSGSDAFSGCSTGMPSSSAFILTAVGLSSACLPTGLSGWLTAASIIYPASKSAESMDAAKSGVPMKTIFMSCESLPVIIPQDQPPPVHHRPYPYRVCREDGLSHAVCTLPKIHGPPSPAPPYLCQKTLP